MSNWTKKQHAKRYRLHRKARYLGYIVDARNRTVLVEIDGLIPPVIALQKEFKYNLQVTIK